MILNPTVILSVIIFNLCLFIFQIINMAETVKQLDMEKMEDLAYDNFVRARLHEAQMSAPFFHTNNRMELLKSLNTLQESTQIICF